MLSIIPDLARRAGMLTIFLFLTIASAGAQQPKPVELPATVVEDKIRGGLLGQILGNLNGLPHEMTYIQDPGDVPAYTPALPAGARTDDDTDIEWVYIVEMQRSGQVFLSPQTIADLWNRHINRGIWCANAYSRHLMDLGLRPPITGRLAINPWANFNISGAFLCETFALISPGMPQTAGKIALNYTHVAIDAEPAQVTQMVTAMIATAFIESDIDKIIDAGVAAVDEKSILRTIAADVRAWHKENPKDWKATRLRIRDKYTHYQGDMADRNGHELNTAATIAALLYGQGDFVESMRMAFSFGWDADNNAASVGTIIGVIKGQKWMADQGWKIGQAYQNTTRDDMPMDETIARFGDRVVEVAKLVLAQNGGAQFSRDGQTWWRLALQPPANVERLVDEAQRLEELKRDLSPEIEKDLAGSAADRARGAYLAICLGDWAGLKAAHPQQWQSAVQALKASAIMQDINGAPRPAGSELQRRVKQAMAAE